MPLWKQMSMIALITLVTACGGGGGGGGSDGGNTSNAPSSGSGSSTNGGSTGSTGGTTGSNTGTSTGAPISKSITLAWTSPSTRENGTALPLSELSGYRIYYYLDGANGSDSTVPVNGGSSQSTSITLTKAGTYYFAISAVDVSGLVSSLSNYVSLTVN